ncbi:MAG: hypothetical protein HEQ24_00230 [Dolichospermum sp. BR01]|jgi:hypothetical protein|nr:hypothetical protein [Dolichospermum sp. BR01]
MDPITWVILIGGFLTGILFRHFWKEIKYWATVALLSILDGINKAIEVTSDAFVYLIKEGDKIYEQMEVYVQNYKNSNTEQATLEVVKQEVKTSDIPPEILKQLQEKRRVKVLQQQT